MIGEQSYRNLAAHLDRLPGGFAPSPTDAHLQLLQVLFTPAEADLAIRLTLDAEDAASFARRVGMPESEAEETLSDMAMKGLIFAIYRDDAPTLYRAAPWIVGIYEFQVNRFTPIYGKALGEYYGSLQPSPARPAPPNMRVLQASGQLRTIPIGKAIEARRDVLPYEQIYELLASRQRFAVAPCLCRREAKLMGKGCDAPEEACLMLDEWADYYARTGRGRYIDREEVLAILAMADEHNLVLQPSNAQEIKAVCCCCGDCCGVLGVLKRQPKPSEAVASPFIASFDPDLCAGCSTCLSRCQMGALSEDGDRVAFNSDRCIGCGLCVSKCPTGALTLVRKPESEQSMVPQNMDVTWRLLSKPV